MSSAGARGLGAGIGLCAALASARPAVLAAVAAVPAPSASAPAVPAAEASARAAAAPGTGSDERLRRVQERRRSLERELQRMREQEKGLLGEVEQLELLVRLRGEQLREVQLDQRRTEARLAATQLRLGELERQLERSRPVLAGRARALYKLGELSYVRLLLSVDRPSDIFRGYRLVTQLARRDKERFQAYRAELQAQSAARAELERHRHEAEAARAATEGARQKLDAERSNKTRLLTELVERKELHAQYVQELEDAEGRLRGMIEESGDAVVDLPVAAFRGSLSWPVAGKLRIPFGRRKDKQFETYTLHNGIEIGTPPETPVVAVHEGSVVFADRFRGYGLLVVLDHGNKHHTLYAHLSEVAVTSGQRLAAGARIGATGVSGSGSGLYFEVRIQGKPEDPLLWLRRQAK